MSTDSAPVAFPAGFLWGAGTAAYQIEGSVGADGRGRSIWDTFSHRRGATRNGDTGDVACDHYLRVDEDLDLIARLGLGAYRFSIAWPRIQPDGKGPANQPGLDFYRHLVDGLRQRGVRPVATLYHWDLPQALEDAGGWTARDTAERFGEFAAVVADALGDGIEMWTTLNEPWCSAWAGYAQGRHAPGRRDLGAAVAATHHLLLAHARGVAALRAATAAPVGITLNLLPVSPASDHPADLAAAHRLDGNQNRLFLEPLFRARYPDDLLATYGAQSPGWSVVADGDLEAIAAPLDFLGVNFYEPATVADPARIDAARAAGWLVRTRKPDPVAAWLGVRRVGHPDVSRTDMDWEVDPKALTRLLRRVSDDYTPLPLYITENGAAYCDYVGPDGGVHDPERIAYLRRHIEAVAAAVSGGMDVRGYFVWSLMDNFEWGHGYAKRFGLIWVDYPTGTRIPKASFAWYQQLIAANSIDPGEAVVS